MRWCRFRENDRATYGLVHDTNVVAIDGTPMGDYRVTDRVHPIEDLHWLPPINPQTFYAVGMNYRNHVRDATPPGSPAVLPSRPEVGYRANNALTGHRSPIIRPADCTGRLEAEGEVVAVLGRSLRRCSREEAAAAVLGWTIGNDVSARTWQHEDRTFWRAKNSDTFKPMGPWIDTDVDPMTSATSISINGETRASFDTGDMIFDALDFLCEMSRYLTIVAGDVLWMGTGAAVELLTGDRVDVHVSGLGTLTNSVLPEPVPVPTKETS